MTAWILYVLFTCGTGCVEVTAKVYDTYQECARNQYIAERAVAWCVKEESQ